MNHSDYRHIATQLSHPSGDDGIKTGNEMYINNGDMIRCAVQHLQCRDQDRILETGPGSGAHVAFLLAAARDLHYEGVDISDTMCAMAREINAAEHQAAKVRFHTGNGENLPFARHSFHRALSVNTLYFWQNPALQLAEIYRVLKPGGTFILAYRSRHFMEKLPFTGFGEFRLYSAEEGRELLAANGFEVTDTIYEKEESFSILQEVMEKDRIILRARVPE